MACIYPSSLFVHHGRHQKNSRAVEAAVDHVLSKGTTEGVTINGAADCGPKAALIAPPPDRDGAMIILARPSGPNHTRSAACARLYNLTPTEMRLVEGISGGRSIRDLALSRRVSPDTVNKHVKLTMAKIGCHRQVDLVQEFLCFPGVHDREPSGSG